jgi:hypothetical protein
MDTSIIDQPRDDRVYKYAFRDFITPEANSVVHVTGDKATLDALDFTLSRGSCVQRHGNLNKDLSIYAPLLTAINHACAIYHPQHYAPITDDDLVNVQHQPWFDVLSRQYTKIHNLSGYTQLDDDTQLTGDRVVVILEALAIAQRIPKVQLGVVAVCAGSFPHACYYPPSPVHSKVTMWLVVETHSDHSTFYGIGSSAIQQQSKEGQDNEDEEAGSDDVEKEQLLKNPTTTPRDTATRVIAQQVPLPADLTATDILTHHQDRLQYNNILKVALVYSNQKIAEECKASQKLLQASGVVKRINTALAWVEREFKISGGALRAVFDEERKANGIVVRGKDNPVDDAIISAETSNIQAAMSWIRAGGPRQKDN